MFISHLTILITIFSLLASCIASKYDFPSLLHSEQTRDNNLAEPLKFFENSNNYYRDQSNESHKESFFYKFKFFIYSFVVAIMALMLIIIYKPAFREKKSYDVFECLSKDQKRFLKCLLYKNLALSLSAIFIFLIFNVDTFNSATVLGIIFEILVAAIVLTYPEAEHNLPSSVPALPEIRQNPVDLNFNPNLPKTSRMPTVIISSFVSILLLLVSEMVPLLSALCLGGIFAAFFANSSQFHESIGYFQQ